MKKLTAWLQWLDTHILKVLVMIYIFLIPLYPKLPLKMVNYTYVAIRIEDIFIAVMAIVFLIQFIRRKVKLDKTFVIMFGLFWGAVFLSFLYGAFVSKSVILPHLGLLHSARRIEYMIIFFIAATTVRSRKDFEVYLKMMFAVLLIVCVYGFGQKFAGWPAVQTMNPEYAKGYILVLDAYARISSTFAGHYDLAAYLLFLMPIVLGYYMKTNAKGYLILFLITLATLILTASRASYISYIFAIGAFLLFVRKFRLLLLVIVATALLTPLSENLTSRLTRTFQETKVFVDAETGEVIVPKNLTPDSLPPGDFGANVGQVNTSKPVVVSAKETKDAKDQIRNSIIKDAQSTGKTLTPAEIEALVEQAFGQQVPVTKYLIDISLSTRFQVEWPRAINAFTKNIVLGSGPSSLGEATDGDYFRWLGEMGLLGTGLFLSIFFDMIKRIWDARNKLEISDRYLFYSFIFAFGGLFINASYIDVFEASKVAYTFWLVAGLFMAALPYYFIKEKKAKS